MPVEFSQFVGREGLSGVARSSCRISVSSVSSCSFAHCYAWRERSDIPGQSNQTFTTQYAYDSLDRLVQVVDNALNTNQYAYNSRHNMTVSTNGRGNRTPPPGAVVRVRKVAQNA